MQRAGELALRHYLPPVALVLLAACDGLPTFSSGSPRLDARTCSTLPLELIGLESIAPATDWARWYRQAEECAGRAGDYAAVRWFSVERITELDGRATNIIGITCADDIYLVSTAELNVRHEILHHVLGEIGHPVELFPRCAEELIGEH